MTELYGHRWTSQAGEKPSELWAQAVASLSDGQVRQALAECIKRGDGWPPSLPAFLTLARGERRENEAMYRNVPKLPAPVSSPETARAALARIRESIPR